MVRAGGEGMALSVLSNNPMERLMLQSNDLSRSFTALNQDSTLIVVIEMSQSSWLVAGMVPGIVRQPLKKLKPEEDQLLKLIDRWREAIQAGREIERVVVAYEAGRDGFWLGRWLRERNVEAYIIHPSSIAVSREHRRAKTDRLDTELLMRAFLGWLRGEKRRHCSMAAIPTIEEEDAKLPNRERDKLVGDRTRIINRMKSTLSRFGIRGFKPTLRKADEKLGELRTAEGKVARAGNARVRRGVIQLVWRFLNFQKDSALARWFHVRAADGRSGTRKTMIVALARKLLIAFWRMATTSEIPEGVILRPDA
jgi:transposase